VDEVELRMDGRNIILVPKQAETDPILGLGSHPVRTEAMDAAVAHDTYLNGSNE